MTAALCSDRPRRCVASSSQSATTLSAPALGLAWKTGLLAGVAAMAGDLGSSFIKRRMGLPSSSRALILDQVPEALLPALICKSLLALTLVDIAAIVALFTVGEMLLSRLLFRTLRSRRSRTTSALSRATSTA